MNSNLTQMLLDILDGTALSVFQLSEQTGADVGELQSLLNELCASGQIAVTKKGKYALPETMGLMTARAFALRNGTPMAQPIHGGNAMKVRALGRLRCLPEDTLLVRPVGEECELVAIPRRGKRELAAFIRVHRFRRPPRRSRRAQESLESEAVVITATACDRRIPYSIDVLPGDVPVQSDDVALLSIERYPEGDQPMLARVVRVLGEKSDLLARLRIIAEDHGFSTQRTTGADAQARALPMQVSDSEIAAREDLRNQTIFTIDGPFSKDYDDAVSLEQTMDGDWRLGVHIADVSHYVQPGSPIDQEALERGTSLYLPGLTVPMLPEALSNDLCSLLPDEDRLTLSLFMTVRDGRILDHRLVRGVIRSCARLTYDAVNQFLGGDTTAVPESLQPTLRDMLAVARQLRRRRTQAGCLELELPETEFTLNDQLVPTDLYLAQRGEAEKLIEDFMLAANETVAMLARTTETPLIYRIHEEPDGDRLRDLCTELSNLSLPARLSAHPRPGELQTILDQTHDHPASDSIRRMLLRSLQRAQYSERPVGHYALALSDYCHFTSPIRRYPDLVVHRMLKRLLDGAVSGDLEEKMRLFAHQSTAREQESTLSEREADALMKARYMADHLGERFDGVVTGVTGWGLYVTLPNTVEGLVPISTLDDYYEFDRERRQLVGCGSRTVFRMGDRVRVQVEFADVERAEIDFRLLPARHCAIRP